jgi:hypothetical protein
VHRLWPQNVWGAKISVLPANPGFLEARTKFLHPQDAPRSLVHLLRDGEADEEKVIKALSAYRVEAKTEAKLVRKRSTGKK